LKRTLWFTGLALTLFGIALTLFLTWAHFTGSIGAICGSGSNCQAVLTSEYSTFVGLPTALYGLLYYILSFGLILVYPVANSRGRGYLMNGLLGLTTTAFVISTFLMGYSISSLDQFCMYCGISFTLSTLLFFGTVFWKVRGGRKEEFIVDSVSGWQAFSTVMAIALLISVGLSVYFYQRTPDNPSTQSATLEAKALAYENRSVGSPTAPIRVIEFFDLECPACQKFSNQVFPKIKKQYIDTGKVLWTFRDFPLAQHHPHALEAHAALSLVPPRHFPGAKKQIMKESSRWVSTRVNDPTPYFRSILTNYGVKNPTFSDELQQFILKRRDAFHKMGVSQTPSFFVNGRLVAGGRPISFWQQLFEKLDQ